MIMIALAQLILEYFSYIRAVRVDCPGLLQIHSLELPGFNLHVQSTPVELDWNKVISFNEGSNLLSLPIGASSWPLNGNVCTTGSGNTAKSFKSVPQSIKYNSMHSYLIPSRWVHLVDKLP